MGNPRMRKTVARAMVKRSGSTAIAKQLHKKRLFTNPNAIKDEELKATFDRTKSWMDNLRGTDLKKMYENKLPETIAAKAEWTKAKLSEDELAVVKRLIESHGDNYRKMSFDRKNNLYQWTESQCENKVKLLTVSNRVHFCEDGKCLCGVTSNSSYVPKKDRIMAHMK